MSSLHDSCMRLDIFAAIHAHVQWKQRLLSYIQGESEEELDPAVVGNPCLCSLGEWLNGSGGENYGKYHDFQLLKESHAEFHRYAAEVITAVHDGDRGQALELLNHGDYAKVSNRVKSMLAAMSLSNDFE